MAVATLAAISGGCAANNGVSKKQNIPVQARPVARVATREELLEKYNSFASSVKTLNATVELKTTAGSQYSGLIQEYHEVKAFLLAARPANVRMVGQAPVIGKQFLTWPATARSFTSGCRQKINSDRRRSTGTE